MSITLPNEQEVILDCIHGGDSNQIMLKCYMGFCVIDLGKSDLISQYVTENNSPNSIVNIHWDNNRGFRALELSNEGITERDSTGEIILTHLPEKILNEEFSMTKCHRSPDGDKIAIINTDKCRLTMLILDGDKIINEWSISLTVDNAYEDIIQNELHFRAWGNNAETIAMSFGSPAGLTLTILDTLSGDVITEIT